jgi:mannitol-1-phosphate/altronate dehydrogenase
MKFRFGSKSGTQIPTPDQALKEIQASLAQQQKRWAEQLAHDPAAFAQLEPQIHLAFQQFADHCAASLLANAAAQPACADTAQKK